MRTPLGGDREVSVLDPSRSDVCVPALSGFAEGAGEGGMQGRKRCATECCRADCSQQYSGRLPACSQQIDS